MYPHSIVAEDLAFPEGPIWMEDGSIVLVEIALGQVTRWMPRSTWLLLAGTAGYTFTRARNAGIALFFWFPAIYMTIGSTSFSSWVPPPIQGRYYAMVVLPGAVMTAITVSPRMTCRRVVSASG